MSSTRSSLAKTAREAIDRGDYSTALRLCEIGISETTEIDKIYFLLVLKALALVNLDNKAIALQTYEEAISLQPSQPLAYQGLVKLFADDPIKCIPYLEKLLIISREDAVSKDKLRYKLVESYEKAQKLEALKQLLSEMLSDDSNNFDLLSKYVVVTEECERLEVNRQVQARKSRLGAPPIAVLTEQVTIEIVASSRLDEIILNGINMLKREDVGRNEMVERYLDRMFKKITTLSNSEGRNQISQKMLLLALESESDIAFRIKAELLDRDQLSIKCPSSLTDLAIKRIYDSLDFKEKLSAIQDCKRLVEKHETIYFVTLASLKRLLDIQLGLLLFENHDFKQTINTLEATIKENHDDYIVSILAESYRALGNYEKSFKLTQTISNCAHRWLTNCQMGWDLYNLNKIDDAKVHLLLSKSLHDNLDQNNNNDEFEFPTIFSSSFSDQSYYGCITEAVLLCRLGAVLWSEGGENRTDRTKCYQLFMNSIQKDAKLALPFLYLARYYSEVALDKVRAERCYIKAISNDQNLLEAAIEVSNLYVQSIPDVVDPMADTVEPRQMDIGGKIFRALSGFSKLRNAQVHRLLAVAYLMCGEYLKASSEIHDILKYETEDSDDSFFLLARAYRGLGRHSAAFRALEMIKKKGFNYHLFRAIIDREECRFDSSIDFLSLEILKYCDNESMSNVVKMETIKSFHRKMVFLMENGVVGEALKTASSLLDRISAAFLVLDRSVILKVIMDVCTELNLSKSIVETDDEIRTKLTNLSSMIDSQVEDEIAKHLGAIFTIDDLLLRILCSAGLQRVLNCCGSGSISELERSLLLADLAGAALSVNSCDVVKSFSLECAQNASGCLDLYGQALTTTELDGDEGNSSTIFSILDETAEMSKNLTENQNTLKIKKSDDKFNEKLIPSNGVKVMIAMGHLACAQVFHNTDRLDYAQHHYISACNLITKVAPGSSSSRTNSASGSGVSAHEKVGVAAWTGLASLYHTMGQSDLFDQVIERVCATFPETAGSAWFLRAEIICRSEKLRIREMLLNAIRSSSAHNVKCHLLYALYSMDGASDKKSIRVSTLIDKKEASVVRRSLIFAAQFGSFSGPRHDQIKNEQMNCRLLYREVPSTFGLKSIDSAISFLKTSNGLYSEDIWANIEQLVMGTNDIGGEFKSYGEADDSSLVLNNDGVSVNGEEFLNAAKDLESRVEDLDLVKSQDETNEEGFFEALLEWLHSRIDLEVALEVASPVIADCILRIWRRAYDISLEEYLREKRNMDDLTPRPRPIPVRVESVLEMTSLLFKDAVSCGTYTSVCPFE